MELFSNSYFVLFLIILIGFIIGRIKIKGISLDVSAVIFVALFFGHYGIVVPVDFQYIGLVLFIFTIGIQAGPSFFESFKKNGRQLATLVTLLIVVAGSITFLIHKFFGVDKNLAIGLLNGSLTSTPGLATAIDITGSPLASIGYGIGYPFGVIGVILFVNLLPRIMRVNLREQEKTFKDSVLAEYPEILAKHFIVENENVIGKSLKDLNIRFMTKAVVSRIKHQDTVIIPENDVILQKGDVVRAVGSNEALERVKLLLGHQTTEEIPLDKKYDVRSILVTNKEVVKKTLGQLHLEEAHNTTITRVRRSGIDLSPSPSLKLQFGDKLIVISSKENMEEISKIFGDNKLSNTDFLPITLGIILGILVGKITVNFGDFAFGLGLTGGILIVALILGRTGKTGPIMWTMTGEANQVLRQIGLLFFLAAVGSSAGSSLESTFQQYGIELFVYGAFITLIPMIVTTFVARYYFKINILVLLGTLTGGMTSTPGLAATDTMVDSDAPAIAYATVYPIAMVVLIIVVQILSLI
ncbi:MAG: transporter [Flavobacteriia bacterium]|nr:transporter [Flavobacteriia bacterium]OIP46554.1 MAG: transporter [Flavobacteriaceae bacterium CG2_30_31_66]PIV96495.1 MAG: transporter [Flavobacteriaceae bacterium CG17_big_fil_post_rev_8_21_14_2_50_31_13]PIY15117.1 MAG: transporter [Flavobacteriaceae bacterium CG_4_10_14_3_um_filter_31_253]PIZ09756.1 MAG: transporter [Flavobacteriaceae bacterium CG_4_10_14_0_8_um_filter_31_99]PJC11198.1 MAG: transporter [Flavobacteriaceae bacterium CG_4_9_14_0_8_um_filter_31_91]